MARRPDPNRDLQFWSTSPPPQHGGSGSRNSSSGGLCLIIAIAMVLSVASIVTGGVLIL